MVYFKEDIHQEISCADEPLQEAAAEGGLKWITEIGNHPRETEPSSYVFK